MSQFVLVVMTFYELTKNILWYSHFTEECDTILLFGRFICSSILHLALIDEASTGLERMKFTLNHSYKFYSY